MNSGSDNCILYPFISILVKRLNIQLNQLAVNTLLHYITIIYREVFIQGT